MYDFTIRFWGQTVMRPQNRVWETIAVHNGRIAKSRVFRDAGKIGVGSVHVEKSESFRVASSPFKIIH